MNRIKNLEYKRKNIKKKRSKKIERMTAARLSDNSARPPSPTRTEKKLSAFDNSESDVMDISDNSYILIQKKQLLQLLVNQICNICQQETVSVSFSASAGFAHKITMTCEYCGDLLKEVYSSVRINDSGRQPFHVNKKIVEAILLMGLGYAGLQRFCMTVDINIISRTSFNSLLQGLSNEYDKYKQAVLQLSREKVRQHYIAMDPKWKNDSVIDLITSYDGSYQKRGFTSLYGIGAVIEIYTGLVIDFTVISKFCKLCSLNSNRLRQDSQEFKDWYKIHCEKNKCQKNFDGSSTAMETYAAEVIWKRSIDTCNARYTTILSDGDAKVFTHLTEQQVYGPDVELKKEECVNHVCKRLTKALRSLRQECSLQGITLGGRKPGALTDKVITDLGSFYRNAIVDNAPHVNLMRSAVLAPLEHYSATDAAPTHQLCPTGQTSWCWYNQAISSGRKPVSHDKKKPKINGTVIERIRPIYERLSSYELLKRCVRGGTQNSNESLHHSIWNQCAKERFQSKKKLEMAVTIAVSEFNMGCQMSTKLRHTLQEHSTSTAVQKVAAARDQQRVRISRSMAQATKKRALKKRKAAHNAQELTKRKREGDCYEAGAY